MPKRKNPKHKRFKDHRTSDRILTITKGNCLYTCFTDFQKAYDSIQKGRLKDKLEKIDINGRFFRYNQRNV